MKKTSFIIIFLALIIVDNMQAKKIGDFNGDGYINIVDVIAFTKIIVKQVPDSIAGQEYFLKGDLLSSFNGRIKTSENEHRIEIGDFGTGPFPEMIQMFTSDRLVWKLYSDNAGGYAYGIINLVADDGNANPPEVLLHGMNMKFYNGANLIMPDWAYADKLFVADENDVFICWDYSNDRIMLQSVDRETNPVWTITPDEETRNYDLKLARGKVIKINNEQVLSKRLPAIGNASIAKFNPSDLIETVHKEDFDLLVAKVNAIIAVLGTDGHGFTADSSM